MLDVQEVLVARLVVTVVVVNGVREEEHVGYVQVKQAQRKASQLIQLHPPPLLNAKQ